MAKPKILKSEKVAPFRNRSRYQRFYDCKKFGVGNGTEWRENCGRRKPGTAKRSTCFFLKFNLKKTVLKILVFTLAIVAA